MDKQAFVDQLNSSIEALAEAAKAYAAYIPGAAGTVNAADEETQLFALFEAYLTAKQAVENTKVQFKSITGSDHTQGYETRRLYARFQVKTNVDNTAALSLAEIRQAEADADQEWENGHQAALLVKSAREILAIIEKQIHDTMPHHIWIKYPARDLAFGIDTGTWGGYCWKLHTVAADGKLFALEHTTYYA